MTPAFMLLLIFLPAVAVPLVLLSGSRSRVLPAAIAGTPIAVSLALILQFGLTAGTQPQEVYTVPWISSLGVDLTFLVDGLSLFYGGVICGIGLLICWYASQYLEEDAPNRRKFYAFLLIFVTAMLGTVFSDSLLLLFVFWELTGVASFLLIGYWHETEEARNGARRALLITAATGLCLLAGIIMIGLAGGTYSLRELTAMDWSQVERGSTWMTWALVLTALGIFGKSAQFPFHFWLPGAMAAPTPVSAYLHSATMVKLGVFLTARLYPVLGDVDIWMPLLGGIGFFTMLLGAFLALRSNDLKALLAYSTISQLGFLIGFYGLGPVIGIRLDFLHVMSHVLYKAALFMVAGIVDHCTGTRDIRKLGGLGRLMPVTATTAAIGAAALAGIPLTTGFISKESLLTDLVRLSESAPLEAGLFLGAVVLSAILTVTVAARFFIKVFLGKEPKGLHFHAPGWGIQFPPLLLAIGVLVFGTFPGLLKGPINYLAVAGLHEAPIEKLALWHGFNLELFISLGVFALAALLYLWADRTEWRWTTIPRWLRFDEAFDRGLDWLARFSKKLTLGLQADWPPAYLPIVIIFLLVAGLGVFFKALPWEEWAKVKFSLTLHPWRSFVAALIIVAMFGVVFLRRWSAQLVALSVAGFFITLYFVLYRAPDLAMTQILVESASVVMILLLLSRFPSSSQLGVWLDFGVDLRHMLRLILSIGVGLLMGCLVLASEIHRHPSPAGYRLLELSKPLADGTNAVNTILVDFRGFDTMGEITVLLIATLGGLGLMMRYKRRHEPGDPAPPPGFFLQGGKKQ